MPEVSIDIPDVFILCGGQGTRFRAVREDIPKALAPINGVPFLDLLLNNLIAQGCQRIILGTGYLSEQIEFHVKHRSDAEYLISREEMPLGTGGSIRHALPFCRSEQVLVLNGDSYIAFSVKSLLDFHQTRQADVTVLLSSTTNGKDYGNVELEDNQQITSFQEKPKNLNTQLINAGVYCLQKELIQNQLEGLASLEKDWFPQWILNGRVFGMVIPDPFYDIGTIERFELAQQYLT